MAITLVQHKKNNSGTTVSFDSTPSAGNLIVVAISQYIAIGTTEVTDNQSGNTYTFIRQQQGGPGTDNVGLFYAKNINSSGTFTITYGGNGTISIYEYSGCDTSNPLDQQNSATGTGTSLSSGNVTVAINGELYFGAAWSLQNGDTWAAGSGWGSLLESETNNDTFERHATVNKVENAQTVAATFTVGTSSAWIAVIATFKPATSGVTSKTLALLGVG